MERSARTICSIAWRRCLGRRAPRRAHGPLAQLAEHLPADPEQQHDGSPLHPPRDGAIWAPENRYRIWFEIEALAAEAMAAIGAIRPKRRPTIRERGAPALAAIDAADVDRIDEIERETRHDVIAFLTWLAEASARTAASCISPDQQRRAGHLPRVQLTQAADLLLADLDAVLAALKAPAFEHKHTLTIGRSHGIHAEPTSFGLKLAGHYAEFARNRARLVAARAEIAVRHFRRRRHLRPCRSRVEEYVAEKLGLAPSRSPPR
jgi:adenylosuccinate lyase